MELVGRIKWYFEQLLPLTYRTHYTNSDSQKKHFCVWKMWLGRSYKIEDVELN